MTMSQRPKVVYLHGIGGAESREEWLWPLNRELVALGFDPLHEDDLRDVDYSEILGGNRISVLPGPDELRRVRVVTDSVLREHLERRSRLRERLPDVEKAARSWMTRVPDTVGNVAARLMAEVDLYQQKETVRLAVWREVRSKLPGSGDVILVGHSLGSVIAADVAARLPAGVTVRSLITIAGPLGWSSELRRNSRVLAGEEDFPFGKIGLWVNIFDPTDVVTKGRGVSAEYPVALDVPVSVGPLRPGSPVANHAIASYATHPAVALAVGEAMWGAGLPATRRNLPARQLHPSWNPLLAKFAYTEGLSATIDPSKTDLRARLNRAREELARRAVAEAERAVAELKLQRETSEGEVAGVSEALAAVSRHPGYEDLVSRPSSVLQGRYSEEEIVPVGIALLHEPPAAPFGVASDIVAADRVRALERMLQRVSDDSWGSRFPREAAAACGEALRAGRSVMGIKDRSPWVKWAVAGTAGVALIAATVVTFGAAAPVGLTGAAAITAGLAAFGPGGMAGGIVLIGALTGIGAATASTSVTRAMAETAEEKRRRDSARRADLHAMLVDQALKTDERQLRSSLSAFIAVVIAQERLGQRSSREEVLQAVQAALAVVRAERTTAELIDGKSALVKRLNANEDALRSALAWAEKEGQPQIEAFWAGRQIER